MMRKLAPTCLILLLLLALMLGIAQTAYAQPPPMPQGFWGSVTIDGNAAPPGTTVSVLVGGTEVASATTDAQGMYACTVSGTSGATVGFYVNGVQSQQTYTLSSGAITKLNLSTGTGSPPASPPPPPPPAPTPPTTTPPAPTPPTPTPPTPSGISVSTTILGRADTLRLNQNKVLETATVLSSADGAVKLILKANTTVSIQGQSLTVTKETSPPSLPADTKLIVAYKFSPDNATFEPPLTLTLKYDLAALPAGVAESGLFIAYWDGSKWSALSSSVDTQAKVMTAQISHFSVFAILGMAGKAAPPKPASFAVSKLKVSPTSVKPGEQVTITATVTNSGGTESSYNAVLKINDVDEAQKQVTLEPKGKQEITFTTSQETAGSYDVTVGDTSGSFKVSMPDTASPGKKLSWPLVGGIAGGVLLIVFLIIVLLRRRAYYY
ncbi:MAG: hypothetical protein MUO97_01875 [Dehalococcoidia bacterium]|nr:hypothetical protein [Dehalococcoidia bacterium]